MKIKNYSKDQIIQTVVENISEINKSISSDIQELDDSLRIRDLKPAYHSQRISIKELRSKEIW